jgi:hypothetical protein
MQAISFQAPDGALRVRLEALVEPAPAALNYGVSKTRVLMESLLISID